ncbi:MAG: MFS transporter [Bacteroidaceae bacterium]|nr:MFS transporter [Bacteroidaceae bacterium]
MRKRTNNIKLRLTALSFLEFAIWGAYLTSMGIYLFKVGLGDKIGWFFAMQGIASIFMPAIVGIIADKWIAAQKMLSLCHLTAAIFMAFVGYIGLTKGTYVTFGDLFVPYALSIMFFMPTIALSNSVSYSVLSEYGKNVVSVFPKIRVFGTIGFIASMWIIDLMGYKDSYNQFFTSAVWGMIMSIYSLTIPSCPTNRNKQERGFFSRLGLDAFRCLAEKRLAIFFIFSMLLGCALQISNGFTGVYLNSFATDTQYADTFTVQHPIIMTSLSQISETLCILMIPLFLSRFGIKKVMVTAMLAWVARFLFLAMGNPGDGVWLFILSMIIYGVAFDFFNIAGSLFVNKVTKKEIRSSAQGLFMLMTNGLGASIGMIAAQKVVDYSLTNGGWQTAWYIFAAYAIIIAILFTLFFKEKEHTAN